MSTGISVCLPFSLIKLGTAQHSDFLWIVYNTSTNTIKFVLIKQLILLI